ncbi:gustatory receptor 14 [Nasonia vitripennis]|uniref:Gustatory receptor n=1 Tax=Nasonia vitripennis TaxID=7425 RepID=A0A7M6UDU1_NASVI|nr:gustatory receptor 14 [Nasonia vitripennis]
MKKTLYVCVYYFVKILGLCPFTRKKGRFVKVSHVGMSYNVLITILYSRAFVKAIQNRHSIRLSQETPLAVIIDTFTHVLSYSTIVSSWLVCAFRQKIFIKVFQSFKNVENLENDLLPSMHCSKNGLEENLKEFRARFIVVNLICIIFTGSTVVIISMCEDMKNQSWFWFIYNIPINVTFNVAFILTEFMRCLRKHYKIINREASKLARSRKRSFARMPMAFSKKLQTIGRIHSDLTELGETVVKLFSLPVLMTVHGHSANIILAIHGLYRILKSDQSMGGPCVLYAPTVKFMIYSIIIFFICSIPVSTCNEADKTLRIIGQIPYEWHEEEMHNKMIKNLMFQLYQKRLQVSIFGFFNLDYSLFRNVWIVIIMYLIFVLQLDPSSFIFAILK